MISAEILFTQKKGQLNHNCSVLAISCQSRINSTLCARRCILVCKLCFCVVGIFCKDKVSQEILKFQYSLPAGLDHFIL